MKINIDAAEEIYYGLIDSFEILNEYTIFNYTAKTFDIFKKIVKTNSKKTKLSFTDSSIILTMKESNISDLGNVLQAIYYFFCTFPLRHTVFVTVN